MLFDSIRTNRTLKLAVLFGFAATAPLQAQPRETPEMIEQRLATYQRIKDLREQIGDHPALAALASAAICAHGSSSGNSSSGTATGAAACPLQRRRIAKGDHGHLLSFSHWV